MYVTEVIADIENLYNQASAEIPDIHPQNTLVMLTTCVLFICLEFLREIFCDPLLTLQANTNSAIPTIEPNYLSVPRNGRTPARGDLLPDELYRMDHPRHFLRFRRRGTCSLQTLQPRMHFSFNSTRTRRFKLIKDVITQT